MFSWAQHITGAIVALIVAGFVFGSDVEKIFFPVLSDTQIEDVIVDGNQIRWKTSFCKLRSSLVKEINFHYRIGSDSLKGAQIKLDVINEDVDLRSGTLSFEPGKCYSVKHSAISPLTIRVGDRVIGEAVYYGWKNFWRITEPLGFAYVRPGDVRGGSASQPDDQSF